MSIVTLEDLIEALSTPARRAPAHFCRAAHIAQGLPGALRPLLSLPADTSRARHYAAMRIRARTHSLVLLLGAVALGMSAQLAAQSSSSTSKHGGIAYRWVDDQGVVHYGDNIPPQYAAQERTVLNSRRHRGQPRGCGEVARAGGRRRAAPQREPQAAPARQLPALDLHLGQGHRAAARPAPGADARASAPPPSSTSRACGRGCGTCRARAQHFSPTAAAARAHAR